MTAIQVENLSKAYQLGQIGTGTISRDLERFWAMRVRGKEDPFLKIGQTNDRSIKGTSDIVWSLKDINFDIQQGDAVGIIGRNGAGKSTLLKLLSRITSPTTGSIKIKGRIASLLEVGTGFHPELSGKENIYLNGAILGMRKKEITRKLDEIIAFSGVERYIDTPVKRYSSGMYVRLAFAVAAHLESEILIVDEVLAVGDAEFQKKCLGKMSDISKGEGRTVLFVSHNMAAVQNLCNKGILLENGMMKYDGLTNKCIENYLNFNNSNFNNIFNENIKNGKNKRAYFKKIEISYFENEKLFNNVSAVPSGKDIFIDVFIENNTFETLPIYVSIDVKDTNLVPVTNFSNQFTDNKLILDLKEETKIRFFIEKLNLRADNYLLSFWGCFKGGQEFDYLENQYLLEITETDFFNSGKIPRSKTHGTSLFRNTQKNI